MTEQNAEFFRDFLAPPGSEHRCGSLPETWDMPRPELQDMLFDIERSSALAYAEITEDEAARWHANGWLSEDVMSRARLNHPQLCELVFVRDLVRSGLDQARIERMLTHLRKPYAYDPGRIAFSFRYGWVQAPEDSEEIDEDEAFDYVDNNLTNWLSRFDDDGLWELIHEIQDMLQQGGSEATTD